MKGFRTGICIEDHVKDLLQRYRITFIDKRNYVLTSRRTNMTWKIEVLSANERETVIGVN